MKEDLAPADFISPLDSRYYGAEEEVFTALHPYLSEEAVLRYQVEVERALLAELEEERVAPSGSSRLLAEALRRNPVTPAEVYAEEERIHHNIRALVNCIRGRLPEANRPYVHLFVTSNDIMDTARALAFRDVARQVLLPDLHELVGVIVAVARQHGATPQIGRTHGRHAVPLTLGYWLANYVDRLGQRIEFIVASAENLRGMISGAVGAHNSFALKWPDDPALLELRVLRRLGLRPSDGSVSTQIIQPEYVTDFAHALVSTFSVLANLADDYRHLMRSEIDEIGETTTANRVGSSTMPHKVNPKNFENVKSLWKAFMPRMSTVYMDQISEHQRDLTNSASYRFLNELVAGFDYAVRRMRKAISGTTVNPEALRRNLAAGEQWTVAEPLYISLALAGQEDGYEISREAVKRAQDLDLGLLDYLQTPEGSAIIDRLPAEFQRAVLDPGRYLGDAVPRTKTVCDDWWGSGGEAGRINPLSLLTARLARPSEDRLIAASA
ncbi:MAG TPA: lyase family protein [Thermoanaerobaculia bacterium]|nr:lyase family protein [Thermoanaerobaculia bacterium]